jgi:hypothetical protein
MAAVAVATLAVPALAPALASADVERHQTVLSPETATFTITEPDGVWNDFSNHWTYNFNVTVQPDGSFTGGDTITGAFGEAPMTEQVTGQFNSDGTVNINATRDNSTVTWSLDHAAMNGSTINSATTDPKVDYKVEMIVSAPTITRAITTDLNHGQYVSSQGGGADNAHSLVGMPVNSSK